MIKRIHFLLIFLLILFSSCTNYLLKKSPRNEAPKHPLNGTYSSLKANDYSTFRAFSNDYSIAKIKTVQLKALGPKCLEMLCITSKDSLYTLLIKGKLKESGFRVRTKRSFNNWFLVLSGYERDKYFLRLEKDKLKLESKSVHMIFFLIGPIMAAGGKDSDVFQRLQ
jgi:hypothetical protein